MIDPRAIDTIGIVDTETATLAGPVIEAAVVRHSILESCVVSSWSSLVLHHENPAAHVNRIKPSALSYGLLPAEAASLVREHLGRCDVVIGWNVDFDREMLSAMPGGVNLVVTWVDAMFLPWPHAKPYAPMHEVALGMGVGIVQVHRALPDCLLLARMLDRAVELGLDVRTMLEHAMQPRKLYEALQAFKDNQLAKDAGFRFDRATTRWLRQATASEVAALPFPCMEVTGT